MQGRKTEAHTETSGWYLKQQQKEQSIKIIINNAITCNKMLHISSN